MNQTAEKWITAAMLLASLAACGGSGSGSTGSGSQGSSSGTGSTASSTTPLALSAANATSVATLSTIYGMVPLFIAQSALDFSHAFTPANGASQTINCNGGGTAVLALTESNGNVQTSAGNTLTVTLNACYLKPIQDSFSGVMTISYQTPASGYQQSGLISFGSNFTDSQANATTLSGQLGFDYAADSSTITVHAHSGSTPLSIAIAEGVIVTTDSLAAIDSLRQTSLTTARNSALFSYTLNSGTLVGSVDIRTATPWSSWMDAWPDAGVLQISGAGSDTEQVSVSSTTPSTPDITLSGSVVGQVNLTEVPGYLFSGTGWIASDSTGLTYSLQDAASQGFAVLQAPALTSVPVNGAALVWIFSRPLASGVVSGATLTPSAGSPVAATAGVAGAALTITPSASLTAATLYQLTLTSTATGTNALTDTTGDLLALGALSLTAN